MKIQRKARKEINKAFGKGPITFEGLKTLEYMDRCINGKLEGKS